MLMGCQKTAVNIVLPADASNRVEFAGEQLKSALTNAGYKPVLLIDDDDRIDTTQISIYLAQAPDTIGLKKEGFQITTQGKKTVITGNDGSGVIYGSCELIDHMNDHKNLNFPVHFEDAPEKVLRGTCIGLQKTEFLPGRTVYEYPYTPESFPWFYDKQHWIEYLDMLVANRMNSVYLWNGHPFASLVKLDDYPFAIEVDDETFKKNEEMFSFITTEADKRGVFVIQMFYNILVSKPFAEHYGIKTQERNRPITPVIADYTRKSVAAFIEKYPNVGLLVCLGEAIDSYDSDVVWFTETILPGVKDGLNALGRTDEPPVLVRAHDTDCKRVMDAALPMYKNLYTMHKYNGESLTTYEPRGPWAKIHTDLSSLGSIHISNVHILANLEPWRWSSPDFVQKSVKAMHNVHGANALHLYPQASYWDWPYTADKLPNGERQKQLDRDWMWYKTWARYAWNCQRDRNDEMNYWDAQLSEFYGITPDNAAKIREAYEESGEIAPKLLRRFGITEGNRQTLLLGMFASQLVNPYKYTIWPGFYESCGPEGEKLIEYVEKEWKKEPHVGELPLDIIAQAIAHGDAAVKAIDAAAPHVKNNKAEFARLQNDMYCYREFAYSFYYKVQAAHHVLNYQWGKDTAQLDAAVPLLEKSLLHYSTLVKLTDDAYLYANSMQTGMRRIPISGDDGKNKTWAEMLPHYEDEVINLKNNIAMLKAKVGGNEENTVQTIQPLAKADVKILNGLEPYTLKEGIDLFSNHPDRKVDALAPELEGLQAFRFDGEQQPIDGTQIESEAKETVTMRVGYFRDDHPLISKAPRLATYPAANEYGQAEPLLANAIRLENMPLDNVHGYQFEAGKYELLLPKGYIAVHGFTSDEVKARNAALEGADEAMDWLLY